MKTKEELNILKEKIGTLNRKLAELTDDALLQVAGGHGESGILDLIFNELSLWLDAHPYATKSDIYMILKQKKDEYANELTEEELIQLNELLNQFAS